MPPLFCALCRLPLLSFRQHSEEAHSGPVHELRWPCPASACAFVSASLDDLVRHSRLVAHGLRGARPRVEEREVERLLEGVAKVAGLELGGAEGRKDETGEGAEKSAWEDTLSAPPHSLLTESSVSLSISQSLKAPELPKPSESFQPPELDDMEDERAMSPEASVSFRGASDSSTHSEAPSGDPPSDSPSSSSDSAGGFPNFLPLSEEPAGGFASVQFDETLASERRLSTRPRLIDEEVSSDEEVEEPAEKPSSESAKVPTTVAEGSLSLPKNSIPSEPVVKRIETANAMFERSFPNHKRSIVSAVTGPIKKALDSAPKAPPKPANLLKRPACSVSQKFAKLRKTSEPKQPQRTSTPTSSEVPLASPAKQTFAPKRALSRAALEVAEPSFRGVDVEKDHVEKSFASLDELSKWLKDVGEFLECRYEPEPPLGTETHRFRCSITSASQEEASCADPNLADPKNCADLNRADPKCSSTLEAWSEADGSLKARLGLLHSSHQLPSGLQKAAMTAIAGLQLSHGEGRGGAEATGLLPRTEPRPGKAQIELLDGLRQTDASAFLDELLREPSEALLLWALFRNSGLEYQPKAFRRYLIAQSFALEVYVDLSGHRQAGAIQCLVRRNLLQQFKRRGGGRARSGASLEVAYKCHLAYEKLHDGQRTHDLSSRLLSGSRDQDFSDLFPPIISESLVIPYRKSKKTGCQASLSLVFYDKSKIAKKGKSGCSAKKAPLPCLMRLRSCHNHSVTSQDQLNRLGYLDELRERFETIFEKGASCVTEAMKQNEMWLRRDENFCLPVKRRLESVVSLSDGGYKAVFWLDVCSRGGLEELFETLRETSFQAFVVNSSHHLNEAATKELHRYVCIRGLGSRGSFASRKVNCRAKLSADIFRVGRIQAEEWLRDAAEGVVDGRRKVNSWKKAAAAPLPCRVSLFSSHCHALDTVEQVDLMQPSRDVRAAFSRFFSDGLGPIPACRKWESGLGKDMASLSVHNPPLRRVRNWYAAYLESQPDPQKFALLRLLNFSPKDMSESARLLRRRRREAPAKERLRQLRLMQI